MPKLYEAARESVAQMQPWMPWCHPGYSLEEATAWVEFAMPRRDGPREHNFVIEGQNGRFLGGCGLNGFNWEHRFANLGYWVRASEMGRGVATAATRALAEWAFANTDLIRLEIVVAVGNLPSLRVAEKVGAVREGVLRSRVLLGGQPHDGVMYSIVR